MERMEEECRKLGDAIGSLLEATCHPVARGSIATPAVAWSRSQGPHRSPAKLPQYGGVTPLEPYLAQVRLTVQYNRWGDKEATVHLALALEGPVEQVLLDLTPGGRGHFEGLTTAL